MVVYYSVVCMHYNLFFQCFIELYLGFYSSFVIFTNNAIINIFLHAFFFFFLAYVLPVGYIFRNGTTYSKDMIFNKLLEILLNCLP